MDRKLKQDCDQNDSNNLLYNQKGFSILELIVAITILGIVSVGGLLSASMVFRQNIKSCYKELESSLQDTRMMAMSKSDAKLKLYTKSDGVYVHLSAGNREIKIGNSGINVSYVDTDGNTVDLTGTSELEISFDRSSGAFKTLGGSASNYCERIVLTDGSLTYTLKMVPKTGKFYRE